MATALEQADRPPEVDQNLDEEETGAQRDSRHAGRYDVRDRLGEARDEHPHRGRVRHVEPTGDTGTERDGGEDGQRLEAVVARAGETLAERIRGAAAGGEGGGGVF